MGGHETPFKSSGRSALEAAGARPPVVLPRSGAKLTRPAPWLRARIRSSESAAPKMAGIQAAKNTPNTKRNQIGLGMLVVTGNAARKTR